MDSLWEFIHEAQERNLLNEPEPQPKPRKGYCRFCGKHVPHGIWAHEKACERKSD